MPSPLARAGSHDCVPLHRRTCVAILVVCDLAQWDFPIWRSVWWFLRANCAHPQHLTRYPSSPKRVISSSTIDAPHALHPRGLQAVRGARTYYSRTRAGHPVLQVLTEATCMLDVNAALSADLSCFYTFTRACQVLHDPPLQYCCDKGAQRGCR